MNLNGRLFESSLGLFGWGYRQVFVVFTDFFARLGLGCCAQEGGLVGLGYVKAVRCDAYGETSGDGCGGVFGRYRGNWFWRS